MQFTDEELQRYVFGDLTELEQTRLEEGFFEDDLLFERISAIEEEIAEVYLRGELEPEACRRFEELLSTSHAFADRVGFVRTLVSSFDETEKALSPEPAFTHESTWYSRLLDALRVSPLGYATAGIGVFLVVLAGLWLASELARPSLPRPELTSTEPLERPSDVPDAPVTSTQPVPFPDPVPDPDPARTAIATFVLTPGMSRGDATTLRLRVPADVGFLRLRLPLEEPVTGDLGVVLRSVSGRIVWRSGSLRARQTKSGAVVRVRVPAKLLANGSYVLTLDRAVGEGERESVENYAFEVRYLPSETTGANAR
jgi:hypothetical protein